MDRASNKSGGQTMKPKILKKEAFLLAGVAGAGDETAITGADECKFTIHL
jgi:hypothetical protein